MKNPVRRAGVLSLAIMIACLCIAPDAVAFCKLKYPDKSPAARKRHALKQAKKTEKKTRAKKYPLSRLIDHLFLRDEPHKHCGSPCPCHCASRVSAP
jgi:hypothetical protein